MICFISLLFTRYNNNQISEPQMPKVLITDFTRCSGGISTRVSLLASHLPNHRVGVAFLSDNSTDKRTRHGHYTRHPISKYKFNPLLIFRLLNIIRTHKYDLVDAQEFITKCICFLATRLTRTSFVCTVNTLSLYEFNRGIKARIYHTIDCYLNKFIDGIITVSDRDKQTLIAYGIPSNKIITIYNAVPKIEITNKSNRRMICSAWNLPDNVFLTVSAGRLVEMKRHEDLIRAVSIVYSSISDFRCLIAGEGERHEYLVNLTHALNLHNVIYFTGWLSAPETLSLIDAADLFVLSSRYEGTPLVILEAASLGKPIAATNAGGIPELLVDNNDALLCNVSDHHQLAHNIKKIAQNKNLAEKLGKSARQRCQLKFSTKNLVDRTIMTYQKYTCGYKGFRQ